MILVHEGVALAPGPLAALSHELAALESLQDVLRWGFACSPQREIVEIVVQDEFCHDVVMSGPDGLYLCFDTT
jgi:hypothetical protein